VTPERVVQDLQLPQERIHVAAIAVEAARQAVRDAGEKSGRTS